MEWVKIKAKHVLGPELDTNAIGASVKLQILTAHLERMPTEKEMLKCVHHKSLKNVKESLKRTGIELEEVLKEVLKDVDKTKKDRGRDAERKRKDRSSGQEGINKDDCKLSLNKGNVHKDNAEEIRPQNRIDKNRIDKSVVVQQEDNHTFYRTIFRIFKIRKKRNPLADTGLLRHLSKIDSSEERALWAVEISEYKKTVFERRKKQNEERKKRRDELNAKLEIDRQESFIRGVRLRFESLSDDQKIYVLQAASAMYTAKNGQLQIPGKPSPRFIVGAMPHEVDLVLRNEIHV